MFSPFSGSNIVRSSLNVFTRVRVSTRNETFMTKGTPATGKRQGSALFSRRPHLLPRCHDASAKLRAWSGCALLVACLRARSLQPEQSRDHSLRPLLLPSSHSSTSPLASSTASSDARTLPDLRGAIFKCDTAQLPDIYKYGSRELLQTRLHIRGNTWLRQCRVSGRIYVSFDTVSCCNA